MSGNRGRWIAVDVAILDASHELHPHSTGSKACEAFAWLDLIGQARWRPGGGLQRGEVRAAQGFLSARWHWSKARVQRFLAQLEEQGRITREKGVSREPDRITIVNYEAYQNPRITNVIANDTADETANDTQEVPIQEQIEASSELEEMVHEVFNYWSAGRAEVTGRTSGPRMKSTQRRLSKIRARLRERYTVQELKQAVDGCLSNPRNLQGGHTDIELICRDQAHVEQYLAWYRNGPPKSRDERSGSPSHPYQRLP